MLPELWSVMQLKNYTVKNKMEKLLVLYIESWGDKLLKAVCIEQEKKLGLKSKQ